MGSAAPKLRLNYIDNLRGMLIIIVVLGHAIQYLDSDFDHNIVFRYIYSFHMPLFIFISGFVSYSKEIKPRSISRRFFQLVIPFIAWSMLAMTLTLKNNWNWLIKPDTSLWFLWVLFWIGCIYQGVVWTGKKFHILQDILYLLVCVILWITLFIGKLPFGIHLIAWYLPFYCLGLLYRKYNSEILQKTPCYLKYILFTLFLIMAYFWMRRESPTFINSQSQLIIYGYKFLVGILGSVSIMLLFQSFNSRWKFISELGGSMTLGIYAIHLPLIRWLSPRMNLIDNLWGRIIALSVLTMSITLIIYLIISRIPLLSQLFLGIKAQSKPA